jgi:hypothetical protein
MYRYYVEDPVLLSLKATIAHGHGRVQRKDYSFVGCWYQTGPHEVFPALMAADRRLPLSEAGRSRRFRQTL